MPNHLFSYDWVTEATRPDYEAMLAADALAFLQTVTITVGGRTLDQSFRGWWLTKGPTSFSTPDAAFRYKRDLWLAVQSLEEIRKAPAAVHEG